MCFLFSEHQHQVVILRSIVLGVSAHPHHFVFQFLDHTYLIVLNHLLSMFLLYQLIFATIDAPFVWTLVKNPVEYIIVLLLLTNVYTFPMSVPSLYEFHLEFGNPFIDFDTVQVNFQLLFDFAFQVFIDHWLNRDIAILSFYYIYYLFFGRIRFDWKHAMLNTFRVPYYINSADPFIIAVSNNIWLLLIYYCALFYFHQVLKIVYFLHPCVKSVDQVLLFNHLKSLFEVL